MNGTVTVEDNLVVSQKTKHTLNILFYIHAPWYLPKRVENHVYKKPAHTSLIVVQSLSHVQLFSDPMECSLPGSSVHGFLRQEYWSGLPFPSSGDLSHTVIKPVSPALAGRFFITEPPGKPTQNVYSSLIQFSHHSVVSQSSLRPHGLQHARFPCSSPIPGAYSNSVHRVSDAIQPSHPLSSPSPPAFNLSQHQGLFK